MSSAGITPPTPLLRVDPTTVATYRLVASSASSTASAERYGSPKFRPKQFIRPPRPETPTRRATLALSEPHDTGFQEMKPLALCNNGKFRGL